MTVLRRSEVDLQNDPDVLASRAVTPQFYRAPWPGHPDYTPSQYQHAGVEYRIARQNGLFGDAPGVGKTAECIMTSNAMQAKRTLVVCPASLRLNWEREIWVWANVENVSTYPVMKSSDGVSPEADYVIVSYDLLRNKAIMDALLSMRFDHLVLDEAHALKDPKGNKRTRAICAPDMLPSVVGATTMASGTILPNQPIEAYNAIRLLNWEAINKASLEEFRRFYYAKGGGMVRSPVWDDQKGAMVSKLHWSDDVRNQPRNLDDLQYRMRKHIMVRRLKEQVLHELPEKQWQLVPLQMTTALRKAMRHPGWATAQKLYELDPEAFDTAAIIDGAVASARRELGEAKAPPVADYIEELLRSGSEKLVVGAYHHSVLDFMKEKLSKYGLAYMDGNTGSRRKQSEVDRFQSDPSCRIILGQMYAMGEGWTLTAAQDVVFCEPDWVPGKNDQFLDRVHRRGQRGKYVIGHMPIVPGTMDERIIGSAVKKDRHIHQALDAH